MIPTAKRGKKAQVELNRERQFFVFSVSFLLVLGSLCSDGPVRLLLDRGIAVVVYFGLIWKLI